uniref:Uncharacterized protein n=1 Tax=Arundo donax TaxID=35708 RepID=A0A0A9C705_ARUDO
MRSKTQGSKHTSAQGKDTTESKTITGLSLITLDKIWGCPGQLLCPGLDPNNSGEGPKGSLFGVRLV